MIYDLKYVVANVMLRGNTIDEREFVILLKHAINGYRKLNLHNIITTAVRSKRIPVDPCTNLANLPDDYMEWHKVGAVHKWWDGNCHRERIINLDYNEDIIDLGGNVGICCECTCENFENDMLGNDPVAEGRVNPDPAQFGLESWLYFAPRINNGQYTAGIYSANSHIYRGSFIIDAHNRVIRFGSFMRNCCEILMQYRSTGISDMGEAFIPEEAIPALIAYVKWNDYAEKENLKMATYWMAQFQNEGMQLALNVEGLREKDIYTIAREGYKQSPKG